MAAQFRALLGQQGYEQSMSRAGQVYDNAHAESLFSRLKAELFQDGAFADKVLIRGKDNKVRKWDYKDEETQKLTPEFKNPF